MGYFKSIDEAREHFINDRFATANGMGIDELFEGGCVCSMDIRDDHRNAIGGVMGGVIYTLADFAFAVASNDDHSPTTGIDGAIKYLTVAKGKRLIARAGCVKSGRTTSVYEVAVSDDTGRKIALFIGTGYKL